MFLCPFMVFNFFCDNILEIFQFSSPYGQIIFLRLQDTHIGSKWKLNPGAVLCWTHQALWVGVLRPTELFPLGSFMILQKTGLMNG